MLSIWGNVVLNNMTRSSDKLFAAKQHNSTNTSEIYNGIKSKFSFRSYN